MTLEECAESIGKTVTYAPCCDDWTETGVAVRVNASFAFVRYGNSTSAKATSPELLTLAEAEVTG